MNGITMTGIRSRLPGRKSTAAATALALAAFGVAGGVLLAGAASALAQATGPSCPGSAADSGGIANVTLTCSYTGSAQYWTVPDGVSQATFTLYGAQGAPGSYGGSGSGGLGAEVTATVPVTAGAMLQVDTGQAGNQYEGAAFGGGGAGNYGGGSGGGASYVISPAPDGSYPFSDVMLVAGGGGGGGASGSSSGGNGGAAGTAGAAGQPTSADGPNLGGGGGGAPGTLTAGGAGGAGGGVTGSGSCGAFGGSPGDTGSQGAGGSGEGDGGGGGGGYFGGGGGGGGGNSDCVAGAGGGGGGGGSSYTGGASGAKVQDGIAAPSGAPNGEVIISYSVPITTLAVTTTSLPGATAGSPYNAVLAATGGDTVYSWSLAAGSSLPSGLSLSPSGVISGTPTVGGTFSVTVQVNDSESPTPMTATQTLSLTIAPTTQTVSFTSNPPSPAEYGGSYTPAASASSGLPVSFSIDPSSATGACALDSSTGVVSFTGVGNCVIDANQAGNATYLQATQVQQSVTISQATQTVSFTSSPPSPAVAGSSYTPAATASSGLPVSFSIDSTTTTGACTLNAGVVSFTGTGTCVIDAGQAGNADYLPSAVQQSVSIGTAVPQVMLTASPSSGATVTSPIQLSATVVPVAGVTDLPSGTVTFSAASSGTIAAPIFGCQNVQVPTSGTGAGQVSCTVPAGTLAAGTYQFTADYSGDQNYSAQTGTLSGYPVSLQTQSVSFTSSPPSAAEYGGSYTPAASATSGLPVSLSIDSTSTTGACTLNAGVVSFTGAGTCVIDANQAGNSTYGAATQAQQSFTIAPAGTSTSVQVTGTALIATVTPVSPDGGTPSGTVTFTVDGQTVGTATLNASGVATLPYTPSGAHTVAASYGGNADYLASSASTATKNPVITAKVASKHAKSKYGWYQSPVTVTFTCTAGSAPLTAACPSPVTVTKNGTSQVVARTIHGTDGGIATVSVVVSIDQTKPKVSVTGIRNKASYEAPGPAKIACTATEKVSGLAAPCKVTVRRTAAAITWTATATSKAGLTATVKGRATLVDFYVAGVPLRDGRYLVTVGHTYTVIAYLPGAKTAPKYVYAAPDGVKPHPAGPVMKRVGPGLYAIRTTITTRMDRKYENWTLGILSGPTLHIVLVTLQK